MMAKTRQRHSKEFKVETVRLLNDSGKSTRQISEELGIPRNTLNRWRAEFRADAAEAFRGNGHRTVEAERIRQLEREVERLRREREILKKVLGIVSQP
jgi:transposase